MEQLQCNYRCCGLENKPYTITVSSVLRLHKDKENSCRAEAHFIADEQIQPYHIIEHQTLSIIKLQLQQMSSHPKSTQLPPLNPASLQRTICILHHFAIH